jgi:hypothetical protein
LVIHDVDQRPSYLVEVVAADVIERIDEYDETFPVAPGFVWPS